MSMDYKTLDLKGITALPVKVKEQFPTESKKWELLTKACIEIWEKQEQKYIIYNGKKYRLEEVPTI